MSNKEYYRKNKNQYLYRASPEDLEKLNEFIKTYDANNLFYLKISHSFLAAEFSLLF